MDWLGSVGSELGSQPGSPPHAFFPPLPSPHRCSSRCTRTTPSSRLLQLTARRSPLRLLPSHLLPSHLLPPISCPRLPTYLHKCLFGCIRTTPSSRCCCSSQPGTPPNACYPHACYPHTCCTPAPALAIPSTLTGVHPDVSGPPPVQGAVAVHGGGHRVPTFRPHTFHTRPGRRLGGSSPPLFCGGGCALWRCDRGAWRWSCAGWHSRAGAGRRRWRRRRGRGGLERYLRAASGRRCGQGQVSGCRVGRAADGVSVTAHFNQEAAWAQGGSVEGVSDKGGDAGKGS